MARIFATLDPNALGPDMELEQGGMVVTTRAPLTSGAINRLVRGTLAPAAGKCYFEVAWYGEGAMLDHVSVGIVRAGHSTAKYVGELAGSYGLKAGNGGVYNAGAQVAATDVVGTRVFVGVLLDLDALVCRWYVAGSLVATVSIAGGAWYPAITTSAAVAYDLRCYVNMGQYAFETPQAGTDDGSGDYVPGWYRDTAAPSPLFLRPKDSQSFTSRESDSVPLITFRPHLLNPDSISFGTRNSVWQWGETSSSSSYGELLIDNGRGQYDVACGEDRRNQAAQLLVVAADGTYDDAAVVASPVVDDVVAVGETAVRVTLRDSIVLLKRPLQRHVHPPWADPALALRPRAITLGAVRNVECTLEDSVARVYPLHDAPITNITAVRDRGALLDPHSAPPQYTPTGDLRGIVLQTLPEGLLTVDMSSQGKQVVIPGVADILAGAGLFTSWTVGGSPPPGWALSTGGGTALARVGVSGAMPQDYVARLTTTDAYDLDPGIGQDGSWLRYDTASLLPGRTYRVTFKLVRATGDANPTTDPMTYGLMVRAETGAITVNADAAVTPHRLPLREPLFGDLGYAFEYTVPAGSARKLYFVVTTPRGVVGGGFGSATVWFYGVRVELLGEAQHALPLQGITLEAYWHEIMQRAGVPLSRWVPADCAAIDAATGYTFGVHIPAGDAIEVAAALELPLASYGATTFRDRFGRYRVRRLVDPTTVDDGDLVADLRRRDIRGQVSPRNDLAPGLTSRAGARRNWKQFADSDFVSDFDRLPAATRAQFKAAFQFERAAVASLAESYRHAMSAPALQTLFDLVEHAEIEIARVVEPYTAGRIDADRQPIVTLPRFLDFTFAYSGVAPPELLFADALRLRLDRHRLAAGEKLAVKDVSVNPYAKRITVTVWSPR